MLKNSVFLKLLLVLLALCGLLTLIAVVSVNDESGGGKVNTPTEEKTEASVPESETLTPETEGGYSGPNVDLGDGRTIVATNSSDNSVFDWSATGVDAWYFVHVYGLKPNTQYQLSWAIAESVDTVYTWIDVAYSIPGMVEREEFDDGNLYSNSISFSTNGEETQMLEFFFASGEYEEIEDIINLAPSVYQSLIFTLYEIAE